MTVVSRVNDSDYPVPHFYLFSCCVVLWLLCCICDGRVPLARRVLTLSVVKGLDDLFFMRAYNFMLHAHKKRGSSW